MSELPVIACPACSAKMKTSAAPGARVRCPKCKGLFCREDGAPATAAIVAKSTPKFGAGAEPKDENTVTVAPQSKPVKPSAPPAKSPAAARRKPADENDESPAVSFKLLIALGVAAAIGLIVLAYTFLGGSSNDGLDLALVKGKVEYKGVALTHGEIAFKAEDDKKGYQAIGFIQEDGTFELKTLSHKGALVGQHVVIVSCREKVDAKKLNAGYAPKSLIPDVYGRTDKTPLRFEVKRGSNEFLVELK